MVTRIETRFDILQTLAATPYKFEHGPLHFDPETFLSTGINCQLLVHIVLEECFLKALPKYYRSSELYLNEDNLLLELDLTCDLKPGDIFLFNPVSKVVSPKLLHLGIVLELTDDQEPMIVHASYKKDLAQSAVSIQKLGQITAEKRYRQVVAIRRVPATVPRELQSKIERTGRSLEVPLE